MRQALAQVRASTPFADLFEFRLDMVRRPDIARLLASSVKPTIAACRSLREGGQFTKSERERLGILLLASSLGATFVDVELSVAQDVLAGFLNGKSKVILSHHMKAPPWTSGRHMYDRMHRTGADVVKLAYGSTDAADIRFAIEFLSFASADRRKAIAVAIGEPGEASRVLYKKFGGWATYAASEDGRQAAGGQLRASVLKSLYRADRLTRATKIFGVIGNPIGQSKGIYVHSPLFQRSGRNAVYCKFPVNNLSLFMQHLAPHLSGFSVTIPHKQMVVKLLDGIDASAKAIGAVNTVVRRNGKLIGTNTDAAGALDAIETAGLVKGKVMLIFGAGGAAHAIAFEAKRRGARVIVANRTKRRARVLAQDLDVESVEVKDIIRTPFDIFVNATPMGMVPYPNHSPLSPRLLRLLKNKVVFDTVYNPPVTKLLREARALGARIVSGADMYVNQAALQSALYTGTKPSLSLVNELLRGAGG